MCVCVCVDGHPCKRLGSTPQTGIVHDWADSFSHAVTQEHEAALIIVACWLLSMTETHWLYMQKADKFN